MHNDKYNNYIHGLLRRYRISLRLGLYAILDLWRSVSGIIVTTVLFLYASLVLYWWWLAKEVYKKWRT